ncbi:MAG: hypothetical protein ABWK05_09230 [Pyrobaculum sp.]
MPHTSTVSILFTVLLLLAFKSVYGITAEPSYVNAFTYTNVTIHDEVKIRSVEGAVLDFNFTAGGKTYLGVKPTKPQGNVTIRTNKGAVVLPIVQRCNMTLSNMTYKIVVSSNCEGDLVLYVNNTRVLGAVYQPPYSGLYYVTAVAGPFYQKVLVVVTPNVTVVNNKFGEVMEIRLSPPPFRGMLRIGTLRLQAGGRVVVDTWSLGAGNYTALLTMGQVPVAYNITIEKATPRLQVSYKEAYTYGEVINVSVVVFVGARQYSAYARVTAGAQTNVVKTPSAISIGLLDAGTYQLNVDVFEDRNITATSYAGRFVVKPAPVVLDVLINNTRANPYVVEYGKLINIKAVPKSLTQPRGSVQAYINKTPIAPLVDTLRLKPGTYNLTVIFTPSSPNFLSTSASILLVVVPSTPEVEVNKTFSTVYGRPLRLEFYVKVFNRLVNATAFVELAGRDFYTNYTVAVSNGKGVLEIKELPAGTYAGSITVTGVGLQAARAVFNVFVSSAPLTVALSVPPRAVYGELLPIRVVVYPQVPGVLKVEINGTVIYSGSQWSYQGWWPPPRSGTYRIAAVFTSSDPNYAGTENVTYVYVDRAQCTPKFTLLGDFGENHTAYVLRRYDVKLESDLPAYLYINNTLTGGAKSGGWVVVFNNTGRYNLTVYFPGDERFYPCYSTQWYLVVKNPVIVKAASNRRVSILDVPWSLNITLKSPVENFDGEATVYKINKSANTTETEVIRLKGNSVLALKFSNPGVYHIYVEYLGDRYHLPNRSNLVVVTVEASYFGIPSFLLTLYLVAAVGGVAAALITKKIFKTSV